MAAAEGGTMQSLQRHIEDMRNLTLCKICLKPFFEPYIISCGHTYCYGCLRSWFGNNHGIDRKKTKSCPDCRIHVREQPAPNYALRDMTHMFTGRTELLPEDETVQEHAKDRLDAAAQLAKDRDGPGLFQGIFRSRFNPVHLRGPIHDFEDDVDRCPVCTAEVLDGVCTACGIPFNDSEFSTDSEEGSIDVAMGRPPLQAFYGVGTESDEDDSEDDSDFSAPNEYDLHDDFVDNDNEDDMDDMDDMDAVDGDHHDRQVEFVPDILTRPGPHRHQRDGSDAEEHWTSDDDIDTRRPIGRRRATFASLPLSPSQDSNTVYDTSDGEEHAYPFDAGSGAAEPEEDARHSMNNLSSSPVPSSHRRRPIVISDDEDEEGGSVRQASNSPPTEETTLPVEENSDESNSISDSASESNSNSNSDSDDSDRSGSGEDDTPANDSGSDESEDTVMGQPAQQPRTQNHRSRVIDDSDDSDNNDVAPRSRDVRQQRLQNQRSRRPHNQARPSLADLMASVRSDYHHSRRGSSITQDGRRGRAARVY